MLSHLVVWTATNTPAPTIASGTSIGLWVTILIAVIAALPGVGGLWFAWKKRNESRAASATEFGTRLAQTAFVNMETQVARLTAEQERWDEDRDQWERDKIALIDKITDLTAKLQVTNQYLQLILAVIDRHGIDRPTPPPGLSQAS